jgi:undecaprenyl-diphosphatase
MIEFEERLFRFVNNLSGQVQALDFFMSKISEPLTWILVGAVISVVAIRTKNSRLLKTIIAALISLAATDLLSFEVIKPIFARERPCWMLAHVNMVIGRCGGSYGFTSNHAANSFAVWYVAARSLGMRSQASVIVLTLATMVSISRVYLGLHFVGDIAGGAILGIITAAALMSLGLMSGCERIVNWIFNR